MPADPTEESPSDGIPENPGTPRPSRYRPKTPGQPQPTPEPVVHADAAAPHEVGAEGGGAEEPPARQGPSQARKTLWIVGGAIGVYYIVRGLWGVFTGM